MLLNSARSEASQPPLCPRGVSPSHFLHLDKYIVCHCPGKTKSTHPGKHRSLLSSHPTPFCFPGPPTTTALLSSLSWHHPGTFLRAAARGGCTSACYPAQIYFATEHGPKITEMKMSLFAGSPEKSFTKEGQIRSWLSLFPWKGIPQLMAYLQGYI